MREDGLKRIDENYDILKRWVYNSILKRFNSEYRCRNARGVISAVVYSVLAAIGPAQAGGAQPGNFPLAGELQQELTIANGRNEVKELEAEVNPSFHLVNMSVHLGLNLNIEDII
jgi:hypothetical protein